jgi:hypothetical protein
MEGVFLSHRSKLLVDVDLQVVLDPAGASTITFRRMFNSSTSIAADISKRICYDAL